MTNKRTQQETDNSNMAKNPNEWVTRPKSASRKTICETAAEKLPKTDASSTGTSENTIGAMAIEDRDGGILSAWCNWR
jgi:hypothetical protein